MRTYKYRLYPTNKQVKIIESHLEICRQIYNKTLETKINAYKELNKNLTLFDLIKLLTVWKQETPAFKEPYAQVSQETQKRVDNAFSRFFAKQNKFPRFKGKGRIRSLKYTQKGYKLTPSHIEFSKIGSIKCRFHRLYDGKIKTVQIIKYPSGKFYANIVTDNSKIIKTKKTNLSIGIDLGIRTSLAVISNGKKIKNPKFIKVFEKSLAKLQRRFSTNKSDKNRHSLAIKYEKLGNSREDFCDKEANKLIKNYDTICFEELNKEKMKVDKAKSLNKMLQDACWGRLVQKTKCKALSADKVVVIVDPAYTSKTCSRCGSLNEISINELVYQCRCGIKIDRDENASLNILRLGLQSLAKA